MSDSCFCGQQKQAVLTKVITASLQASLTISSKGFQMSDDGPSTHPSHDLEVLEEEDDK